MHVHHAEEAQLDPVCGMTVKPTTKHRATYQGREYLFCNPRCKEKFEADPAKYVEPAPAPVSVLRRA